MICNARNRHGKVYPYFVCTGRHQKRTGCTFRAILIERVEDKVIDHYATQQLAPDVRQALGDTLSQEFEAFFAETAAERRLLTTRKQQLLAERSKLLKAHLADAVPLDLLKTEQARIGAQLAYIEQRLANTEHEHSTVVTNLNRTLDFVGDLQAAYEAAAASVKRQFNQAMFKRIYIYDNGQVSSELAEPFDTILDRALHQRALEITQDESPLTPVAKAVTALDEPDWELWEASFEESEDLALVGEETPRRPFGRLGLTKKHLVDLSGAFSNPFETDKSLLIRLSKLQEELLRNASAHRREPREAPTRRPPVLELITRVLEQTDRPMRACEIHTAAVELHGGPLRWHSVREALSAYTKGGDRRFRRVGYGIYELAEGRGGETQRCPLHGA